MKLAIAIIIVLMLSANVCHIDAESYCNPHNLKYKLWDCDGSTAKFNETAYHEVCCLGIIFYLTFNLNFIIL